MVVNSLQDGLIRWRILGVVMVGNDAAADARHQYTGAHDECSCVRSGFVSRFRKLFRSSVNNY